MRPVGWCVATSVAVLVALVVLGAPPAPAAGPAVQLTVDRHALHSGQQLVASARASGLCVWSLNWGEQAQSGRGTTLSATFTAPPVTTPTRIPVRARCFTDTPGTTAPRAPVRATAGAQRLTVGVPAAPGATVVVTVLPPGGATLPPVSGGLPATGGPSRWIVLAGLGAVLVGATCARIARRRRAPAA